MAVISSDAVSAEWNALQERVAELEKENKTLNEVVDHWIAMDKFHRQLHAQLKLENSQLRVVINRIAKEVNIVHEKLMSDAIYRKE
jgi:predicted nuclease with TOPRIM domain